MSLEEEGIVNFERLRESRRAFLHRTGGLGLALATPALLAACGDSGSSSSSTSSGSSGGGTAKSLNVLTWQGYHDKPWLAEYQKKTGVKINAINVGSPAEMFAKVKANPGQFDIVLATSGWFKNYADADLLVPIDMAKVPNLDQIKLGFAWKDATTVNGKTYGILYNWGDQPLGWLTKQLPSGSSIAKYSDSSGVPNDWNILWDPMFKGKVSVFDDPTSVEPMIPMALGFPDPYNLNEEQFTAFEKKLMELRPQVKRLTSGYDDQVNQFATGEAAIGYINIATVALDVNKKGQGMRLNHEVKQGMPAWSDNFAITKQGGGKKLDTVYKFIGEGLTVPWQARFIAKSANSGTLNYDQATSAEARAAGLGKKELATTLIPATRAGDSFFKGMRFFQSVEDLQRRLEAWNKFKLGL
jgi:spermidine/putrescine-binding protein